MLNELVLMGAFWKVLQKEGVSNDLTTDLTALIHDADIAMLRGIMATIDETVPQYLDTKTETLSDYINRANVEPTPVANLYTLTRNRLLAKKLLAEPKIKPYVNVTSWINRFNDTKICDVKEFKVILKQLDGIKRVWVFRAFKRALVRKGSNIHLLWTDDIYEALKASMPVGVTDASSEAKYIMDGCYRIEDLVKLSNDVKKDNEDYYNTLVEKLLEAKYQRDLQSYKSNINIK